MTKYFYHSMNEEYLFYRKIISLLENIRDGVKFFFKHETILYVTDNN